MKTRYMVMDDHGRAMCLGHYSDTPAAGVLLRGQPLALFYRRQCAANALRRTRNYAKRKNLPWNAEAFRICRVTVQVHE